MEIGAGSHRLGDGDRCQGVAIPIAQAGGIEKLFIGPPSAVRWERGGGGSLEALAPPGERVTEALVSSPVSSESGGQGPVVLAIRATSCERGGGRTRHQVELAMEVGGASSTTTTDLTSS